MSYKIRRKNKGKNKHHSLINKLKKENKIDDKFQSTLSSLTLEEVIGLKLEQSSKILNGRQFGLPLWRTLDFIVKEAVMKWVISASRTDIEAARYLGLDTRDFYSFRKMFNIVDYFDIEDEGFHDIITKNIDKEEKDAIIEDNKGA
jgi:hypothetical protein